MIIGAIILIFVSIVTFFMQLLPDYEVLPDIFENAWDYLANFTSNLIWVIPGGENILAILRIWPIIITAIFIWKGVNWIIRNR